jgi:uncharacterized protein (TIGR02246 family)
MATRDEVEGLYRELLASWNGRDAGRYARLFTADGSVVGFDGSSVEGRDAIHDHLASIFADHEPASYVGKVREVRELVPGVALLRAVVGMVPPGANDINPDVNAAQSLVAVTAPAGWRVAHFANTPAAFHGWPEAREALTSELREELHKT